jgi:glycosyltransferase involved in cell wall biosynthesis
MQKETLFSIITVTYNCSSDLTITHESLLPQNKDLFEWIIVDGDSRDTTLSTAHSLKNIYPRLSIYSEPDNGVYHAMNKGIGLAKGKYLLFLNAGDTLTPDILDKVSNNIHSSDLFIYGNVVQQSMQRICCGYFDKFKLGIRNIPHQAIFYHRDIFKIVGKYNLNYPVFADYAFNIHCFGSLSEKNIKYLNFTIANYQAGGLSSSSVDPVFFKNKNELIQTHLGPKVLNYYLRSGAQFFDIFIYLKEQNFTLWDHHTIISEFIEKFNQLNSARKNNHKLERLFFRKINKQAESSPNILPQNNWHIIDNNCKQLFHQTKHFLINQHIPENKIITYNPVIYTHQLQILLKTKKPLQLILFGGGLGAINTIKLITELNKQNDVQHKVKLIFDNSEQKLGSKLDAIKIKKPDIESIKRDDIIIISSQWKLEIRDQLIKMGLPEKQIVDAFY